MDKEEMRSRGGIRIARGESPPRVVAQFFRDEVKDIIIVPVFGLLFSVVVTIAASYIVSSIADSFWQVYFTGIVPSLVGVSLIGIQIFLAHEKSHHAIYKPTEWVPQSRIRVALLVSIVISYHSMIFLPVDNPELIWKHPAISVLDAATIFLLTLSAPYLTKICHDYLLIEDSTVQKVKRISYLLAFFYFLFITIALIILFGNNLTTMEVLGRTAGIGFSLAGAICTLTKELKNRSVDEISSERSTTSERTDDILGYIEGNKIVTFSAAILAGTGLPIIAGASAGSSITASTGAIAPGLILFYGYLTLLFFGWLLIFGPILISMCGILAISGISIANEMLD